MADIVLKDRNGNDVTYEGIKTVTFDTPAEGVQATFTEGIAMDGLEVLPDFSGGDMAITAPDGTLVKSATIKKPDTLTPENVRNGVEVGGVAGAFPAYPFIEYTRNDAGEITAAKMYGFTDIPRGCFAYCSALTSVDLSECPEIASIGAYAFRGCSSLTYFDIPDSVTSIGESAFHQCSALQSIAIPEGVTSIEPYTFYQCSALQSIAIPEGVTSVGNYAFYGCTVLADFVLPESLESIGNFAFETAAGLTSLSLPNVTSIGNNAFSMWKNLTAVTFGNKLTTISMRAFQACSALKSITIPDSVTLIDQYAFISCSALTTVVIGSAVSKIGAYAFNNCTALTSVTFKDTTTWYRAPYGYVDGTAVSSSYIGNASTMATYLRSTYVSYYWYKT